MLGKYFQKMLIMTKKMVYLCALCVSRLCFNICCSVQGTSLDLSCYNSANNLYALICVVLGLNVADEIHVGNDLYQYNPNCCLLKGTQESQFLPYSIL